MRWLACALLPGQLVVIDRVEDDLAVVELGLGDFVDVPLLLLPPGSAEGDWLRLRRRGDRLAVRVCPRSPSPFPRGRLAARTTRPLATQPQDNTHERHP